MFPKNSRAYPSLMPVVVLPRQLERLVFGTGVLMPNGITLTFSSGTQLEITHSSFLGMHKNMVT